MKHAITSLEYLLRMKGFKHGASGLPIDQLQGDSNHYQKGYAAGQRARRDYSKAMCEELNLENPEVHAK